MCFPSRSRYGGGGGSAGGSGSQTANSYSLKIVTADKHGKTDARNPGFQFPVVDLDGVTPPMTVFGTATAFTDLNPEPRIVSGGVGLAPGGVRAMGLTGYQADWESSQSTNGTERYLQTVEVRRSCPPSHSNLDYRARGFSTPRHGIRNHFALLPCPFDSPYAPVADCRGGSLKTISSSLPHRTSCDGVVSVQAGDNGHFYISTPNAGYGDYSSNVLAEIYFPYGGSLEIVLMDVSDRADVLVAFMGTTPDGSPLPVDLAEFGGSLPGGSLAFSVVPGTTKKPFLIWRTDQSESGKGWVLRYKPAYEELFLHNVTLPVPADGRTNRLKILPLFGGKTSHGAFGYVDEQSTRTARALPLGRAIVGRTSLGRVPLVLPTKDWVVSAVDCSSSRMRCPIPALWAKLDYQVPAAASSSSVSAGGGGSSGDSSCSQYKAVGAAGNVVSSYFEFGEADKTLEACGVERWTDRFRGIKRDQIVLKPARPESIPLFAGDVLPPDVLCVCETAVAVGVLEAGVEEAAVVSSVPAVFGASAARVGASGVETMMRM